MTPTPDQLDAAEAHLERAFGMLQGCRLVLETGIGGDMLARFRGGAVLELERALALLAPPEPAAVVTRPEVRHD